MGLFRATTALTMHAWKHGWGQTVISHGPDRELTVGQARPRR
jgi:hypothetical protein